MAKKAKKSAEPAKPSFGEFLDRWNDLQGFRTPPLHERIADWLVGNWQTGKRELLLLAFRNSGKSTLVGLFCAWLLLTEPRIRILVLAADHALAKKMVRNVKRVIERHPDAQGLKPKRRDQWASDQFTVEREGELRDPSMLARGIIANVTGSRADVVICDDVEVPNNCDTAPKRADLRERLSEIDYVLVPGGLQLYVGTPHNHYSLYAKEPRAEAEETEPFLAGFERLELPVMDETGVSAWPERFPPDKIARLRKRGGAKFESQMLLLPVNPAGGRLDPDKLRYYDQEPSFRETNGEPVCEMNGRRMVSAACWWDPAYGAPDKGDSSVVAALFVDDHSEYWLHRILYMVHDPAKVPEDSEADQLCRQVARLADELFLPKVTVESNGLGKILFGHLRKTMRDMNIACAVQEIPNRKAKEARILEAFDPVLAAGTLHAHRSVWSTPFIAEMREWRPAAGARDDGLDAVAGAIASEPVRLRLDGKAPDARPDWRKGARIHVAKSDFSV